MTPRGARTATAPRRRRPALTPDERRLEIIMAAIPLLAERGPAVTTLEIAAAADVSEGTIFHVFADKQELIAAAVQRAGDVSDLLPALTALVDGPDLVLRLGRGIDVVREHMISRLPMIVKCGGSKFEPVGDRHPMVVVRTAMAALLAPDAESLSHTTEQLAVMLVGLCMAAVHQEMLTGEAMPPGPVIAALFLDGARRRTRR